MVHDFDRPVNVTGYDSEDGSKVFQTVTGVLDNDHPQTVNPYLMLIYKYIHLDYLEHHLMCSMQCRMNGIKVSETTKYHRKGPDESTHDLQVGYPSD